MTTNHQTIYFIVQAALGFVLLGVAFAVGRLLDRRHLRRLTEREAAVASLPCHQIRLPASVTTGEAFLVTGTVVMGCDYFKLYVGRIINLVGGNIDFFEAVLERARREAHLRMIEQALAHGAHSIWNVRIETASIGGMRGGVTVEILCYGTALRPVAA